MKYPTLVERAIDEIVHHYSKYDRLSEQYCLDIDDVPEFDLYELVALLMQECPERACEATGYDNPDYEKKMLPALVAHMKNTNDLDNMYEYLEVWQKGILSYHKEHIKELIENELEVYNAERAA